jgi:hypothetical protein
VASRDVQRPNRLARHMSDHHDCEHERVSCVNMVVTGTRTAGMPLASEYLRACRARGRPTYSRVVSSSQPDLLTQHVLAMRSSGRGRRPSPSKQWSGSAGHHARSDEPCPSRMLHVGQVRSTTVSWLACTAWMNIKLTLRLRTPRELETRNAELVSQDGYSL